MAKNFKRVQPGVFFRHLGDEVYHAGFIYDIRPIYKRSKVRIIKIFRFSLHDRAWSWLFEDEGMHVESFHRVIAWTGFTAYSGKEVVRKELLDRAKEAAEQTNFIHGFECLWVEEFRGNLSEAGKSLLARSKRLERLTGMSAWEHSEAEGTRCPDCGQTTCDTSCPGMT